MSMTLAKPQQRPPKLRSSQRKRRYLPHTPDHICLLPPGRVIAEKMFEMGIDSVELAKRMSVSVETIEKLLRFEIPLTESVARKLERTTWMPAELMMRFETSYQEEFAYAMEHPEIPAYLGGKIVNKPKRAKKMKTEPQS